jgi:hypothetical protein
MVRGEEASGAVVRKMQAYFLTDLVGMTPVFSRLFDRIRSELLAAFKKSPCRTSDRYDN